MYKLLFSVFLLLIFYSCGNVFEESIDRQFAQQIVDKKGDVKEYETKFAYIINNEDTVDEGYRYAIGGIRNIKSAVTYGIYSIMLKSGLEEVGISIESNRTDSWSEINTSYYETSGNSYDVEIYARDKDSYTKTWYVGNGSLKQRRYTIHYTETLGIDFAPSVVNAMLKNNDGYLIFKGSKSYKLKIDERFKWALASILIANDKL